MKDSKQNRKGANKANKYQPVFSFLYLVSLRKHFTPICPLEIAVINMANKPGSNCIGTYSKEKIIAIMITTSKFIEIKHRTGCFVIIVLIKTRFLCLPICMVKSESTDHIQYL